MHELHHPLVISFTFCYTLPSQLFTLVCWCAFSEWYFLLSVLLGCYNCLGACVSVCKYALSFFSWVVIIETYVCTSFYVGPLVLICCVVTVSEWVSRLLIHSHAACLEICCDRILFPCTLWQMWPNFVCVCLCVCTQVILEGREELSCPLSFEREWHHPEWSLCSEAVVFEAVDVILDCIFPPVSIF